MPEFESDGFASHERMGSAAALVPPFGPITAVRLAREALEYVTVTKASADAFDA